MSAITLWQPWASLIAEGLKVQETRSWAPPDWLIDKRIAIHAAKRKLTKAELQDLDPTIHQDMLARYGYNWTNKVPYGAIIATAHLFGVCKVIGDCKLGEHNTWGLEGVRTNNGEHVRLFGDCYGDYSVGRYIWGLQHIQKKSRPIPMAGRQGLWKCDMS